MLYVRIFFADELAVDLVLPSGAFALGAERRSVAQDEIHPPEDIAPIRRRVDDGLRQRVQDRRDQQCSPQRGVAFP